MATLLDKEWVGGRLEKTWSEIGDDGRLKLIHEVIQDCEPAMDEAKLLGQHAKPTVLGRFKANVCGVHIEEACRIRCKAWGISYQECFREVMQGRTERAKDVWKALTEGRDFAKLQASHWK